MEKFTADIQDLNSRHSFIGDDLAGELSSRFPRLEHAWSAADQDELAAAGVQATGNARVIALLPLNSSPAARQSLENAFRGIATTGGENVVVDMDIAEPHTGLLGHTGGEGLSDHFLYGVSPDRILSQSSSDSSLKILAPGTFTPRAGEIYSGSGWDSLIDELAAGTESGTVILLGPPADKFSSLAALGKADRVMIFSGRLDQQAQQGLPAILEKMAASLPESSEMRFVWVDSEPPVEEEPELEDSAEEPETLTGETPTQLADAEQTPEPRTTDETLVEAPVSEDLDAEESADVVPDEHPGAEPTQLSAEDVSLAAEKMPGSQPLDDIQDDSGKPDTFDSGKLPGLSEPSEGELAGSGQTADEDDEEIYLPEELLFLDDDEKAPAETASIEAAPVELGRLPDLSEIDGQVQDGTEQPPDAEEAAVQDAETGAPVLADDVTEEAGEETDETPAVEPEETVAAAPGTPDEPEQSPAAEDEPVEEAAEIPAADEEPSGETEEAEPEDAVAALAEGVTEETDAAESAEDTEAEIDAEALFTDEELDDEDIEPPAEEKQVAAETGSELNGEAQVLIDKFLETADQPKDAEPDLELDTDPLGEGELAEDTGDTGGEAEAEPAVVGADDQQETTEEPDQPEEAPAGELDAEEIPETEDLPAGEAVEDEAVAEVVVEAEAEREDIDEVEELKPEELEELEVDDLEPLDEASAGAADEAEAAEAGAEAAEAAEEETEAVEAEAPEKAEAAGTADEETGAELDEVPEEPAAESEAEPAAEAGEEAAGEKAAAEPGAEAEPAVEAGEEAAGEEAAAETGAEAEPAAEAGEEAAGEEAAAETAEEKPADAVAGGEGDGPDVPDDDELDELLASADAIDDLDGGITLDELDEVDGAAPVAAAAKKKKKKKSKPRGRPLVLVTILLVMGFGLFFVWKQGYVSTLVRDVPALSGLASFIPGVAEQRERERAAAQAAADSAALADSLSRIPPAPVYDKLGYSIQIGSYRYLPHALAARDRLRQSGLETVYVVPLELDSLGNWNRLYVGMYESAGRGDTAFQDVRQALRQAGIPTSGGEDVITRHTPLTLMVAEAHNPDSLQAVMDRLESNFIPTYMVQLAREDSLSPPVYRLYSGAFENEEQAVFLRNRMFNLGVRAMVIEREGRSERAGQEAGAPSPPA
ncbi:MAG: hypothetical protein FVQ81_11070 [Candidatus Glassbacteria bacterium]|nr:hypothetical protein [Candidatus Glassbacteria bacterium]